MRKNYLFLFDFENSDDNESFKPHYDVDKDGNNECIVINNLANATCGVCTCSP